MQWYEADGLLACDDHLFVIEVKAGAFTYTSPTTDLSSHIESLKNLVVGAATQGCRFVDYLESAPAVKIADADHREIGELSRSDFRHITVCAITLDAFTELAARAQHLKTVGVDVGSRPVWVLSIDDLRVYADLFDNPLRFLHFVEQRVRANKSSLVDLDDEMAHLGLYVKSNNYSLYAENLVGSQQAHLSFNGYRELIDDFFAARARGETPVRPKQRIPARIEEIIDFLGVSNRSGRSAVASLLLNLSGEFRDNISQMIDRQLASNVSLRRQRPLSTHGDIALTICVSSPAAPRASVTALGHARAVVSAAGEQRRLLLELEYSTEGTLINIHWRYVDLNGLTPEELAEVHHEGQLLRERRVQNALTRGKVGRNAKCPCGTGKKYKRCCGA